MTTMNTEPSGEEAPERLIVCTDGHKPAIADWAKEHMKSCDVEYVRADLLDNYSAGVKEFTEKTYRGQYEAVNDAATRMRERCVDAIKSLRATPRGAAYNNAVNDAIHKVESLTLDGEK